MSKKNKFFADDGWAMWVDGDDVSTIYLNNWLNPKGKSYMDVAVHIRGVKETTALNMYFPFPVNKNEIEDISLKFVDENLSRAIFSSMCLIDYKKNKATSEIAYNGKTVDIVHQNIAIALVVKFAILILGAFGLAPIGLAVFGDVGVLIIVIFNALRTLRIKL